MSGPSAPFAREHWTEFAAVSDDRPGHEGETLHLVRCDAFDTTTRLCTAYDTRPPICSGFPYYGRGAAELHSTFSLPPGCGHLAEHYRMLPIVECS